MVKEGGVGREKVGTGKVGTGNVGREKVGRGKAGEKRGSVSLALVYFWLLGTADEEVLSGRLLSCTEVLAATFVLTTGLSFGCSSRRTPADRCD